MILPTSEIYKINGKALPMPSGASVSISGLQESAERTDDGLLHKKTIGYKRKVALTYEVMSQEELAVLLNMVFTDPVSEYFEFTYVDPQKGNTSITCYVNDADGELYSAILYDGMYKNVKFNAIER